MWSSGSQCSYITVKLIWVYVVGRMVSGWCVECSWG